MKIAIQGALGSFHHQAATKIANKPPEIIACKTFSEVFQAVNTDSAPYGLCAIENNIHGSINEVYRLLERHNVWIIKDVRIHIAQALIGNHPTSLDDIKLMDDITVLSQGPAFAQVEQWLDTYLPRAIRQETHDTAASVRMIMESGRPQEFAIASAYAAEIYGAYVIQDNIQDEPDNYTRFILFQKVHQPNPVAKNSSIILKTDHTPGALLRALTVFAKYGCNLTKLDSHPITGDQRHYAFYIDYEMNGHNHKLQRELTAQGCSVKVLGEY